MEKKIKTLVIMGNVKEVREIIKGLIERHGNITVNEYLNLMGKERVVLS